MAVRSSVGPFLIRRPDSTPPATSRPTQIHIAAR